jgi:hypothetical protein
VAIHTDQYDRLASLVNEWAVGRLKDHLIVIDRLTGEPIGEPWTIQYDPAMADAVSNVIGTIMEAV